MQINSLDLRYFSSVCGLTEMSLSEEATGSEPAREKKTEVSEDSREPFEFSFVSVFAVSSTKC